MPALRDEVAFPSPTDCFGHPSPLLLANAFLRGVIDPSFKFGENEALQDSFRARVDRFRKRNTLPRAQIFPLLSGVFIPFCPPLACLLAALGIDAEAFTAFWRELIPGLPVDSDSWSLQMSKDFSEDSELVMGGSLFPHVNQLPLSLDELGRQVQFWVNPVPHDTLFLTPPSPEVIELSSDSSECINHSPESGANPAESERVCE